MGGGLACYTPVSSRCCVGCVGRSDAVEACVWGEEERVRKWEERGGGAVSSVHGIERVYTQETFGIRGGGGG